MLKAECEIVLYAIE